MKDSFIRVNLPESPSLPIPSRPNSRTLIVIIFHFPPPRVESHRVKQSGRLGVHGHTCGTGRAVHHLLALHRRESNYGHDWTGDEDEEIRGGLELQRFGEHSHGGRARYEI